MSLSSTVTCLLSSLPAVMAVCCPHLIAPLTVYPPASYQLPNYPLPASSPLQQLPNSRNPRPTCRYEAIPPGHMAVPDLYLSMLATRSERLGTAFTAGRRLSTMANSTALC